MTSPEGDQNPRDVDAASGLINPRLSDVFGLIIPQDKVDFVVPHLHEDLPLSLDPFLLWKSEKSEYRALHSILIGFLEQVRMRALAGQSAAAHILLSEIREPQELGLGYAAGKDGSAIGPKLRSAIIEMFRQVPQLEAAGLDHIELLALLVPHIAEDRVSDFTASVLKRWLADFTSLRCAEFNIPTRRHRLMGWDPGSLAWRSFDAQLPYNPEDNNSILLSPLDLLRRLPWINYRDYYSSTFARLVLSPARGKRAVGKEAVLVYNRNNYDAVRAYAGSRERRADECTPDPLFSPYSPDTLKRKAAQLRELPTGRDNAADRKYESLAFDLLASLLYPELDLAAAQERTISGSHIRDVIFHNDGKTHFLRDLRDLYAARQLVFELKNVAALVPEHVNQLYRYLDDENMGRYGILLSRRPPPRNVLRNIVDLHSSKRAAIICLDDGDIQLMIQLLNSGRRPVEALRKKHVEFSRRLPQ